MLAPDTILQNRYRIIRQLGQGGMGTVYEAIDQRFDSQVAVKEAHFTEDVLRKQFEREARLLHRLRHPAIARVSDHFTEGDGQFLVMDFIEGEDLWVMLQKRGGAFPLDKVLGWADQLLDALAYMHGQEPPVIHRDIKPQNLKLTSGGRIILLDFGLAKGFVGQTSRITTYGSIYGYTRDYASLEQIKGTGTDAGSDLYSLAATLFHLMTGEKPLDVLTRLSETADGRPDPLLSASKLNPQVTESVAGVLARAMRIGRSQRYANAVEMRDALKGAASETETVVALRPTVTGDALVGSEREESPTSETTILINNPNEREEAVRIDEPVMAININQQYPRARSAEDLYNSTRYMWRVNRERAQRAQYAFAVYQGVIKEVYKIHKWIPASEGRYEFIGELAPEAVRQKYKERRMPVRQGQNPIRYFNC